MEVVGRGPKAGVSKGGDCPRAPLAPETRGQLGPLARMVAWLARRATGMEPQRIFTTLGRHRRLFRWWVPFAGALLLRTRLPRRDVELLVLRSALNCSSSYEWAQHVPLARAAGLGLEQIRAVADPSSRAAPGPGQALSERQRLLIEAADELHSGKVVGDSTWRHLVTELDEHELIELCMVVGHYEMLAMVLNSLGVQPEPSTLAALDDQSRSIVATLHEETRGRTSRLPSHRQDTDANPVGEPPTVRAPT